MAHGEGLSVDKEWLRRGPGGVEDYEMRKRKAVAIMLILLLISVAVIES